MSISVRDAGVWKESDPWVRDGGVWKPVDTGFVRDAGVWKEFYSSGPPAIGGPYEGGYYAGLIQVGAVTYALIVAPKSLGGEGPSTLQWKTSNTSTTGTTSVNDGVTNTDAMMAAGAPAHPAANFCRSLTIGGYSDWYLPAKDELEILYRNFKPTTAANHTSFGANSSSVPPTGNYTSGNPAQTSVALFKTGAAEAFIDGSYWSSTQSGSNTGLNLFFLNGNQNGLSKNSAHNVRAVRRVPISI